MNLTAEKKIAEFLEEDLNGGDITSDLLPDELAQAEVTAEGNGVAAGIEEARIVFEHLKCETEELVKDGAGIRKGERILLVTGNAKNILAGERTALNIMMRMSGIATAGRELLREARKANPKIRVVETRKTAPGLRYFDKKAAFLGTGSNHRHALGDMILLKDNHLKMLGLEKAITLAKARDWVHKTEAEVENQKDALLAAKAGADIIMLDNFTPENAKRAIDLLKKAGLREKVLIEISGGITKENIGAYAKHADVISVGALTHSVKALSLTMHLKR